MQGDDVHKYINIDCKIHGPNWDLRRGHMKMCRRLSPYFHGKAR